MMSYGVPLDFAANDNAEDLVVPLAGYILHKPIKSGRNDSELKKRLMADQILFIAEDVGSELYDILREEGFDVDNPHFYNDYVIIMEFLKAAMYRDKGIGHLFQEFLDEITGHYAEPDAPAE